MTHSDKAALRGEPSYVWRAGQDRRLRMIVEAVPQWHNARVLDNGCGLGTYLRRLQELTPHAFGLEYERERGQEANRRLGHLRVVCAAGERLPYANNSLDVILSNEVIEHVQDDAQALAEMARVLKPGGRALIFCPNRWYPVETHGIYWHGRYIFGNIPFINYLPNSLRNKLAPHVRAYSRRDLFKLLNGLPLKVVTHTRIFGGYDNLIARLGGLGRFIRAVLQGVERTPLNLLGLSHWLVVEKL